MVKAILHLVILAQQGLLVTLLVLRRISGIDMKGNLYWVSHTEWGNFEIPQAMFSLGSIWQGLNTAVVRFEIFQSIYCWFVKVELLLRLGD